MKFLSGLFLFILGFNHAWANETTESSLKITPVVASALEFGGDILVDVTFSDGSKSNIEAGRGIYISGGFITPLSNFFEIQSTLGLKWTSTKQAKNGVVDWVRYPLEFLGFYHNKELNFRAGAGLVYQLANNLKGTDDASVLSMKFENSLGFVVAGEYYIGAEKNRSLGLRYTSISYKPQTSGYPSVNGNSFGVSLTFWP